MGTHDTKKEGDIEMQTHLEVRKVGVGTTVEIERDGSTERWRIAEAGESDVSGGVITRDAPLARAILGAARGETRTFRAGGREWTVLVCGIRGGSLG